MLRSGTLWVQPDRSSEVYLRPLLADALRWPTKLALWVIMCALHRRRYTHTCDTGLGVHIADLPTERLPAGARVRFTLFWPEGNSWEGVNFEVTVDGAIVW